MNKVCATFLVVFYMTILPTFASKSSKEPLSFFSARLGYGSFMNLISSDNMLLSYGSPELLIATSLNKYVLAGAKGSVHSISSQKNTDFSSYGIFLRYYLGQGYLGRSSVGEMFESLYYSRLNWFVVLGADRFRYALAIDPNLVSLDFRIGNFYSFNTGAGLSYIYNSYVKFTVEVNGTFLSLASTDIRINPQVYFLYTGLELTF